MFDAPSSRHLLFFSLSFSTPPLKDLRFGAGAMLLARAQKHLCMRVSDARVDSARAVDI